MIEHMFDTLRNAEPDRERIHRLVDTLLDADPADPGAALTAAVLAHHELGMALDGRLVRVLPLWEASGDWVDDGSPTVGSWLRSHTGRTRANAGWLRRTGLLAAPMPVITAALEAGLAPIENLGQVVRVRTDQLADLFDRDESLLVQYAIELDGDALKVELQRWRLAALEELGENEPDRDPGGSDLDTLKLSGGIDGRGLGSLDLTAETHALVRGGIDAEIDAWHQSGIMSEDGRTRAELEGAAFRDIFERGLPQSDQHGSLRPSVIGVADLDTIFGRAHVSQADRMGYRSDILQGGPVAASVIRKLLCDAQFSLVITDTDSEPLWVGTAQRLATPAQWRALLVRSGGTCEWPGCTAPHTWCRAHHITYWEHDGPTDMDNLAMICTHHHGLIHDQGFKLARGPDGLRFTNPYGRRINPPYATAA
jgi:Domain of unknown function (DUF222)